MPGIEGWVWGSPGDRRVALFDLALQEELFGLEDDELEDEDEDEALGAATGGARAGDRARGDSRAGGRDEAPPEQADDQVGC